MFYSPSKHPRCMWLSSFRRIQSELYKKIVIPKRIDLPLFTPLEPCEGRLLQCAYFISSLPNRIQLTPVFFIFILFVILTESCDFCCGETFTNTPPRSVGTLVNVWMFLCRGIMINYSSVNCVIVSMLTLHILIVCVRSKWYRVERWLMWNASHWPLWPVSQWCDRFCVCMRMLTHALIYSSKEAGLIVNHWHSELVISSEVSDRSHWQCDEGVSNRTYLPLCKWEALAHRTC